MNTEKSARTLGLQAIKQIAPLVLEGIKAHQRQAMLASFYLDSLLGLINLKLNDYVDDEGNDRADVAVGNTTVPVLINELIIDANEVFKWLPSTIEPTCDFASELMDTILDTDKSETIAKFFKHFWDTDNQNWLGLVLKLSILGADEQAFDDWVGSAADDVIGEWMDGEKEDDHVIN